jgi:hypothetical protein
MKQSPIARNLIRAGIVLGLGVLIANRAWNSATSHHNFDQRITPVPSPTQNADLAEQIDNAMAKYAHAAKAGTAAAGKSAEPAAPKTTKSDRIHALGPKLSEYSQLKKMVLISAENKEKKNQLLNDVALLQELGRFLRQPGDSELESQHLQSLAIDLLLEARAKGDSLTAEKSLRSIAADNRIEDKSVSLKDRKALAGIKAELLYQWAAQEPQIASSMPELLPGPMSQMIWQNIQEAQARNRSALAYDSNSHY